MPGSHTTGGAQLAAFAAALRARGRSEHTVTAYTRDVRGLLLHAGVRLAEVTPAHVSAFIASSPSPATQSARHSSLNAFFKWARREGLVPENPVDQVERPEKPALAREFLSRAEVERFIEGVESAVPRKIAPHLPLSLRDLAVLHVLARGGLQTAEAVALDVRDVTFAGDVAVLAVRGEPDREVRIGGRGGDALRTLASAAPEPTTPLFRNYRGERLGPRSLQRRLTRWSAAVGLDLGINPRALRNTLARHLQEDGAEPGAVARLLGHARALNAELAVQAKPKRPRRLR